MARKEMVSPPEEGSEAPEFNLPGAQGGQLRLGLRTARGPVIVAFYRGGWSEECVGYFKALAEKEREINVAGATLVGIGPAEPEEAREFVRKTGFKSYVLYDYVRVATREYGLLQKDPEHGDAARPAAFLIGADNKVIRAWLDERPAPEDLLAEVSKITGLPREPGEEGEAEENPKKRPRKPAKSAEGETAEGEPDAGTEEKPAAETAASEGSKAAEAEGKPEGSRAPDPGRPSPEGKDDQGEASAHDEER